MLFITLFATNQQGYNWLNSLDTQHLMDSVMYSVSEDNLVSQLQAKDGKAFEYLIDVYASALYGSIQKIIGCPHTAQDVLQNVLLKIWSNTDKYLAAKGRLFTWMINIARNESFDYLRSKQFKQAAVTDSGLDENNRSYNTVDHLINCFDVKRLIGQLPLKERAILDLFITGYTCKEIARLIGLPEGTVKTRMRTSYRKLRMALQN